MDPPSLPPQRPLHATLTRKKLDALSSSLSSYGLSADTVAVVVREVCRVTNFDPDASTRAYSAYRQEQARRKAAELGVSVSAAKRRLPPSASPV